MCLLKAHPRHHQPCQHRPGLRLPFQISSVRGTRKTALRSSIPGSPVIWKMANVQDGAWGEEKRRASLRSRLDWFLDFNCSEVYAFSSQLSWASVTLGHSVNWLLKMTHLSDFPGPTGIGHLKVREAWVQMNAEHFKPLRKELSVGLCVIIWLSQIFITFLRYFSHFPKSFLTPRETFVRVYGVFHTFSSTAGWGDVRMSLSVGWDHTAAGLTLNGNAKVINNTARLLCPKKALNRTNLTKSNYSGSGRKGKPLEVRIKFLGREKEEGLPGGLLTPVQPRSVPRWEPGLCLGVPPYICPSTLE